MLIGNSFNYFYVKNNKINFIVVRFFDHNI